MNGADDDILLARMRRIAAEADPPPAYVAEMAYAALGLRDLDGELAALSWDSAAEDTRELAGTRGREEVRLLSFETESVGIDLQVSAQGTRRAVLGQVVGVVPARLSIETEEGAQALTVDDIGTFRVDGLSPGRTRLRVCGEDGSTVTTSWITI
jgi:hypothetical protein